MNVCIFTGRLTAKPELKSTPNGKNVCNFSLAVERRFKDSDGKPIVDYIDFVAWEHNATFICKWFDKGVKIAVSGEMQTRSYEKDGQTRKISEVLVSTVEFADGKREANADTNAFAENTNTNTFEKDTSNDFIPVESEVGLPWEQI